MTTMMENFAGNPTLIMLFILGFPLLNKKVVENGKIGTQGNQDRVHVATASSSISINRSIDLSLKV